MASLLDMAVENPLIAQIQEKEGWHPGSVAYRHNNPGNLHFVGQKGAVKGEPAPGGGNYAKFPDYQTGAEALHKQIQLDAERGLSFRDFAKKYAPDKNADGTPTGNDSEGYAQKLANSVGRNVTEPLKTAFVSEEPPTKPTGKSSLLDDAISKQQSEPTGIDWLRQKATEGAKNIANGVLGGVGLPDMDDPSWKNPVHPMDVVHALNPWEALTGMGRSGNVQLGKVADAAKRGDPLGVINHTIGAAVPPLGPAVAASDMPPSLKSLTQMGVNVGSLLLGGKEAEETLPEKAGKNIPGTPPPPAGPPPLAPKPLTPEEANLAKTTSKIVQATQPGRLTPKVQEAMKTYAPNLKAQESKIGPIDARTQAIAHDQVEADLKRQFDSYRIPAEQRGATMDGNALADAHMGAIDYTDKLDHPSDYQNAKDLTDQWRRPMPIQEGYERMQKAYTDVKNYFNATPTEKTSLLLQGAKPARSLATYNAAREQFLKAIDPDNDGEVAAQIQKQRGDAITMREPFNQLRNKLDQEVPTSTPQRLLTAGAGAAASGAGIADMLFRGDPYGAIPAAGGAYGVYKALKPPTDLNAMVADAFKNYKGPRMPDLTNPKADAITDPTRLLEAGPTRMGSGPDASGVSVSSEPRQGQVDPFGLNATRGQNINPEALQHDPLGMTHIPTNPYKEQFGGPAPQYDPVELRQQTLNPGPEFAKQRSLLEVQPPTPPARKFPGSALFGPEDDYFFPDWEYPKAGQSGSMETPTTGGAIPNR